MSWLLKGKKEEDLASGMIQCLHKMGKKPKIIYTDDEGAMNKEAIQKVFTGTEHRTSQD